MSDRAFVDTVAWIALINSSDALHENASARMAELVRDRRRLLTTDFVLLEVADALSAPEVRGQTIRFLNGLRGNQALQIVAAGPHVLESGWNLFCQRPDKDWGLTDCTGFAVMQRERLFVALTADHHFIQAGFRALMLETGD